MRTLFLVVFLMLCIASPLSAQTSLVDAFNGPVKQVGLILEGASVQVADPIPDPELKGAANAIPVEGNPGPGIKQEILRVLGESKVPLSDSAKFKLQTKFAVIDNPDDKKAPKDVRQLAVSIKMVLISKDSETAEGEIAFKAKLALGTRIRDILKVGGGSGGVNPDNDNLRADHAQVRKILGKPPAVDGTVARATPDSPYGMEIIVDGRPRSLMPGDKEAFVELNQGEEYQVRVTNTSGEEIAVALSIDGVNVFEFAEAAFRNPKTDRPLYEHYLIDKSGEIAGWFHRVKPPGNYDAFLVTEYGKGAASKLGKPQGIGMIHLAISKSFPEGSGKGKAGAETGFGRKFDLDVKPEIRRIDPPHEFITLRYVR